MENLVTDTRARNGHTVEVISNERIDAHVETICNFTFGNQGQNFPKAPVD